CTSWGKFSRYFYHWAIYDNKNALKNLSLITSHGFGANNNRIHSKATDFLRMVKPGLHAWTTSMTWGGKRNMKDYDFVNIIRMNIYDAKVNAVIPWAALQTLTWVGGDPNPGTAFFISEDGNYEIKPQYYYYKQLCMAGRGGMKVALVETEKESGIELIAFESNSTENNDALVIINLSENTKEISVEIDGIESSAFSVTRSSETEKNVDLDEITTSGNKLTYKAPGGSVTTFISK
ncbi:MAG: hypothetical protein MJB12_12765, partial [Firmicutes bacterium]|nr:hypothetical protein [Bacillota bacterium]